MWRTRAALVAAGVLVWSAGLTAQAGGPTAGSDRQVSFSAGVELRRDAWGFRFENPSSFDTPFLVPHAYEQRYESTSTWLVARGRYAVLGRSWDTELALARWGLGLGHDYDTFFQPDGDTVVYGTTADTELGSFQFTQRADLGAWAGLRGRMAYRYRRDRAQFRPSDSITRHTNPPSETRFFNTGRETTISSIHEMQFGFLRPIAGSPAWQLSVALDAAPLTLGRQTTLLPDKYGDREIVGVAKGASLLPSVALAVRRGRMRLDLRVDYSRTWPYGDANRYTREWFGVAATIGFAR